MAFNRRLLLTGFAGFIASGGLLAASGCGGGSGSGPSDGSLVTRGQYGPLRFTLSTTKSTFAQGEEIPLVFTITNTGSNRVTGFVGERPGRELGDLIESEILQGETRIWTKDGINTGGTGIVTGVAFAPGESKRYTFSWTQKGNYLATLPPSSEGVPGGEQTVEGPQVASGTYRITAYARVGFELEGVFDEDAPPQSVLFAVTPMDITIR